MNKNELCLLNRLYNYEVVIHVSCVVHSFRKNCRNSPILIFKFFGGSLMAVHIILLNSSTRRISSPQLVDFFISTFYIFPMRI